MRPSIWRGYDLAFLFLHGRSVGTLLRRKTPLHAYYIDVSVVYVASDCVRSLIDSRC